MVKRKSIKTLQRIGLWFISVVLLSAVSMEAVLAQRNNLNFTEINNQTYDPRCTAAAGSAENPLVGDDNISKALNFLMRQGLSGIQAAAIIGNFVGESGSLNGNTIVIDPTAVNPSSGAFGIAQWLGGRKQALFTHAATAYGEPKSPEDLGVQLDYFWKEVTSSERAALSSLEKQTSLGDDATGKGGAVEDWARKFERPSEKEIQDSIMKRYTAAKIALAMSGNPTSPTGSGSSCKCEGDASGKIVVIDPGHSKNPTNETDPASGIKSSDYENQPEMQEVWDVSQKVRAELEKAGFKVIMTKSSADSSVGLIERANIANKAKADMAISIHNDHGQNFDSMKWVTPQEVGRYRETDGKRKTFTNQEVAQKSQSMAKVFVEERKKAEGGNVEIHGLDFPAGRGLPSTGNIAIVQLFSEVPWVYHEVGGKGFNADKYAAGLIEGTKKALGAAGAGCSNILGNGSAVDTAINYAWPTYRGSGYTTRKPEYIEATAKAQTAGKYIGGCNGVDCGGFTTRVMQDSGADPDFNNVQPTKGPVTSQEDYMKRFPDKYEARVAITSPSQLRGGDIAIAFDRGHTFMWVGDQTSKGFQTHIASASLCDRAPMAGREAITGNRWYSLKK